MAEIGGDSDLLTNGTFKAHSGGGGGGQGSPTIRVTATLTVAATSHAAGDCIGGKITFDPEATTDVGLGGTIQSAVLCDADGNAVPFELVLFNDDPTLATITDDAPFEYNGDIGNVAAILTLAGSTPDADGAGVINVPGIGQQFVLADTNDQLYGALICREVAEFTGTPFVKLILYVMPG